jgi:hypothetical protein
MTTTAQIYMPVTHTGAPLLPAPVTLAEAERQAAAHFYATGNTAQVLCIDEPRP